MCLHSKVVRREDSVLGLRDDEERRIAVDSDHNHVCKFWDPAGRAFDGVKDAISEMAEEAITCGRRPTTVPATSKQCPISPI